MTFDSCSLNEISELPTTPEDASANTTANSKEVTNGKVSNDDEDTTTTDSSGTLVEAPTASTSCVSSTLPSKLDHLEKLDWDDIDDLLQVERRHNEKDRIYETMPVKLPSSQSSSDSSPSKTSSETTTTTESSSTQSATTISSSSDNFMTATGSLTANTNTQNTTTVSTTETSLDNYETCDDNTLKPMDLLNKITQRAETTN